MEADQNHFREWLFYLTVPTLTVLFLFAAALVYKTFRAFTFDSAVLLMCALINLLAILSKAYCYQKVDIANQCLQALMLTIMLFFTCSIYDNHHVDEGKSSGRIICYVSAVILIGLLGDSIVHLEQY
jgi:putative effector of murein hydrolase